MFLGPQWSDLQNSKGVHLIWVTKEPEMGFRAKTNSHLVIIGYFRHKSLSKH